MALKYEKLIKQMTLEEKVSLTSGKTFWETQNIDRLGIPSIFLADGPHGIRKQAAASDHLGLNQSLKATCFPCACSISSSFNLDLAKEIGEALGKEARHQDVNVLLGPGMNIKRNPLCGRNFEYFSEDPYLAGKMAANYVQGIQESGVSACIKHFCCNSQEFRRMNSDSVVDERALREIYLTNFEIAVKEGKPNCIMSSYNLLNSIYTNENPYLDSVLRKEWGFDGVVVTDWGGENDRVKGLLAGNQLEMPGNGGDTNKDILDAINSKKLSVSELDKAVDKVLDLIFKTQKEKDKDYSVNLEEHHDLARKAAEESIVLLENDDCALPLNDKEKICVIGPFAKKPRYQGAGSSKVNPYKVENFLNVTKSSNLNYIGYKDGYKLSGKNSRSKMKKALKLATNSDTVLLLVGLDELSEAEGIDRKNMSFPKCQLRLIEKLSKLNKKVVAVIFSGSSLEIPFSKQVNGLIHCHLTGEASSEALLNVLTGKVNPSGKLSESYPSYYKDSPTYNYFHDRDNSALYKESIFVGYRYYDKTYKSMTYPFGYGLSYTNFAYSHLLIDEKGVTFRIRNTGTTIGKEVAQLYVGLPQSKLFRPIRELKGFIKIELKPNEIKEVSIPFDEYTFRVFNSKTKKWEIETGDYDIIVGDSSENTSLKGSYHVEGNMKEYPYEGLEIPNYFNGNVSNVSDEEFIKILGQNIKNRELKFINKRKTRIEVDIYTTISDLKYAKGWSGRLFSGVIKFAIGFLKFFGAGQTANTLIMGVYYQPLKGLSRLSGGIITWSKLNGLITMFNGQFFKGLKAFFRSSKKKA